MGQKLNAKPQRAATPLSNLERVRRYRRRQRDRNKRDVLESLRTGSLELWIGVLARSADATLADLARALRDHRAGRDYQEPHSSAEEVG